MPARNEKSGCTYLELPRITRITRHRDQAQSLIKHGVSGMCYLGVTFEAGIMGPKIRQHVII